MRTWLAMRWTLLALTLGSLLLASGCSGGSNSANQAASAPPASSAPAESAPASAQPQVSAASAPAEPSGEPTPQPTPNENLLSPANGTIVRAYPAVVAANDARNLAESPPQTGAIPESEKGPFTAVYELPGQATFSSFWADLPSTDAGAQPVAVTFAVSSTGATGGFKDAGTLTAGTDAGIKTLSTTAAGRWVKVTTANGWYVHAGAKGTVAALAAPAKIAGLYIYEDAPFKDGAFVAGGTNPDHALAKIVTIADQATLLPCSASDDSIQGAWAGRNWTAGTTVSNGDDVRVQGAINDDGSIIATLDSEGTPRFYLRTNAAVPPGCLPQKAGNGPQKVLHLTGGGNGLYLVNPDAPEKAYAFTNLRAPLFEPSMLDGTNTVILDRVCRPARSMNPAQLDALSKWLPGHKFIIYSSDACAGSGDYSWLSYPFKTKNPGANGEHGSSLFLLEDDALGTNDKNDAQHYVDVASYASGNNQLGDGDTVVTKDPHWCGHLFVTNDKHDDGILQMYAITPNNGVAIFDGLDNNDDASIPQYQQLHRLEMDLPVPASGLPCSASVAGGILIAPSQEASFVPGKSTQLSFAMQALSNQGWSGHVTVATDGPFPATVSPASFDLTGAPQPLAITVNVPQTAKPGAYTILVKGDGGSGNTAQAGITLIANPPPVELKKAPVKKQQRIRIYGIHFDYDSARIQPQSEAVIAQIADMLNANPTWRFQVEGHTDSDGGAAYNLGLSQRRAQAVVDDLVTRYHIARSRLVAKGFGLTKPVASNATAAGKALNRRVELLRLQ